MVALRPWAIVAIQLGHSRGSCRVGWRQANLSIRMCVTDIRGTFWVHPDADVCARRREVSTRWRESATWTPNRYAGRVASELGIHTGSFLVERATREAASLSQGMPTPASSLAVRSFVKPP